MIYAILIGVIVAICLAGLYLWKRLAWDTTRSRRARIAGSVFAGLLALLIPVTMAAETVPWVAWPGFIWLAFLLYLTLVLLALEIPTLVVKAWLRRGKHDLPVPAIEAAEPATIVAGHVTTGSPGHPKSANELPTGAHLRRPEAVPNPVCQPGPADLADVRGGAGLPDLLPGGQVPEAHGGGFAPAACHRDRWPVGAVYSRRACSSPRSANRSATAPANSVNRVLRCPARSTLGRSRCRSRTGPCRATTP